MHIFLLISEWIDQDFTHILSIIRSRGVHLHLIELNLNWQLGAQTLYALLMFIINKCVYYLVDWRWSVPHKQRDPTLKHSSQKPLYNHFAFDIKQTFNWKFI